MDTQNKILNKVSESSDYFRFQVFQGKKDENGRIKKTKGVGMAYLKMGQNIYTLRLWMFSWDRYYLLPNKSDSAKYFVMTREPNRNENAKNKYYWNIVGNASVDSTSGTMAIAFDLLAETIFMSIHPESSAHSVSLPEPEDFLKAA